MRVVSAEKISETVCELFMSANFDISPEIENAIREMRGREIEQTAKDILDSLLENYRIAREEGLPICQDCGMAIVFAEIGQDVHIDGSLEKAVNEGVRRAYRDGYLRKSVVRDPVFDRSNTGDNTPAVLYTELVEGDGIRLTVTSKGFGSENCSRIKFLLPTATKDDIRDFVVESVRSAGPNFCPPGILGIGIGGTMEKAAFLAKKALLRDLSEHNPDENYRQLEEEILEAVNGLGIGPAGFGGYTTVLGVSIESFPTHIASLPVALNVCCHASRHKTAVI